VIDTTKAKADAEEGLRIAEKTTEEPWVCRPSVDAIGDLCVDVISKARGNITVASECGDGDGLFIADSRTRAPEAYRNVIEMADVIDGLNRRLGEAGELYGMALFDNERLTKERDEAIADYSRSIANREQDLAEFRALSARVTAAELAEEKMTRKAEEHYDRAVKAEAERDALRLDVVRLRSENEKHLEQSWAFETEIEQLREQLDKYVDVKFAKDVS
jgi:tetratricopeptide (TPR) repeat protein